MKTNATAYEADESKQSEMLHASLIEERKFLQNEMLARLGIQQLINNFSVGVVGAVIGFGQLLGANQGKNPAEVIVALQPAYPILAILLCTFCLAFIEQERMIAARYRVDNQMRKVLEDFYGTRQDIITSWRRIFDYDTQRLSGLTNGILSFAKLSPTLGLGILLLVIERIVEANWEFSPISIIAWAFALVTVIIALLVGGRYVELDF